MPKTKKLTVKETKLVQAKVKGLTHKQASGVAGYSQEGSDVTVVSNTTKTLSKPHVKDALDIAFKKHGITLDTAIRPIAKALVAVKQNEYTGEITEDIQTQLKGSDRALKLMGVSAQDTNNVINNFGQMILEQGDKYND
jgi:phage terminase small subunit